MSDENYNKIYDRLMELKMLTVRMGTIHELQRLQIEMLPMAAYPAISATANVVIDEKMVEYNVMVSKMPIPGYQAKAKKYITETLRKLLWDDTVVKIGFKEISLVKGSGKPSGTSRARRAKSTRKV